MYLTLPLICFHYSQYNCEVIRAQCYVTESYNCPGSSTTGDAIDGSHTEGPDVNLGKVPY